jgi:predicted RND superfamily exporter protein
MIAAFGTIVLALLLLIIAIGYGIHLVNKQFAEWERMDNEE